METIVTPPNEPATPEFLLTQLAAMNISVTLHHHEAVFRVADSGAVEAAIPGTHCRNLFLRDKKGQMILVSAANQTKIDLKKLEPLLGCGRLSFASPERLWTHLGVRPGSVCPYAIMNDKQGLVRIVLDAYMMHTDIVNFHPLVNTMTIGIRPDDLVRFIEQTGHKPDIVDLTAAAP